MFQLHIVFLFPTLSMMMMMPERFYRYLARPEKRTVKRVVTIEFSADGSPEVNQMMNEMDLWWTVSKIGRGDLLLHDKKDSIAMTVPGGAGEDGQDGHFLYEGTKTDAASVDGFAVLAMLRIDGKDDVPVRYRIRKIAMTAEEVDARMIKSPMRQTLKRNGPITPFSGPIPEIFADELAELDEFLKRREFEAAEERTAIRERIMTTEDEFLRLAMQNALDLDEQNRMAHEKMGVADKWTGPLRRDFIVKTVRDSIELFYQRMLSSTVFTADELMAAGLRFLKAFNTYVESVLEQLEEQYPGEIRTGEYAPKEPTPADVRRMREAQRRLDQANAPAATVAARKKTPRERELEELLQEAARLQQPKSLLQRDAELEVEFARKKEAEAAAKAEADRETPPGARRKKIRPLTPEERMGVDAMISPQKNHQEVVSKAALESVQKIVALISRPIAVDACVAIGCNATGCEARCKRCKEAMYCSRECQVSDWHARHAKVCKPYAEK
jgi:arsenate reductase-like glutaredoxin family protein